MTQILRHIMGYQGIISSFKALKCLFSTHPLVSRSQMSYVCVSQAENVSCPLRCVGSFIILCGLNFQCHLFIFYYISDNYNSPVVVQFFFSVCSSIAIDKSWMYKFQISTDEILVRSIFKIFISRKMNNNGSGLI